MVYERVSRVLGESVFLPYYVSFPLNRVVPDPITLKAVKKSANTDLKVAVDGTHGRIKLLIDTGCVMNQKSGYSRVKIDANCQ